MATKKKEKTVLTKPPVDLQIKVDPTINNVVRKLSISASWSIASPDHGGGQKFKYQTSKNNKEPSWRGKKAPKATSLTISSTATSKTFIEKNFSNYYPFSGKDKLQWVHVEVTGKRKNYSTSTTKYTTLWSNPAARTIHIIPPPEPEISEEVPAGETDFSRIFSWTVPQSSTWIGVDYKEKVKRKSKKKDRKRKITSVTYSNDDELVEVFYNTGWQSILVDNLTTKNFDMEDESNWKSTAEGWQTGTTEAGLESNSVEITEDRQSWTGNYSYTRYIRVRSRGPGGASDWDYGKYIYYNAIAPSAIDASKAVMDSEGNVTITDNDVETADYPSRYISYQYLIDVPETTISGGKVTISPPSESSSWVEAMRAPSGSEITFPTHKPVNDKLTWVRKVFVGTDGVSREGEATKVTSDTIPLLSPPTGIQISDIDVSQKRMTVDATNNSSVGSAYLFVYCRNAESTTKCIGMIPHGESGGVTVQIPSNWDLATTDIGVQAVLGDYIFDSVSGSYSASPIYMQSEIIWDGGTLPSPPTNLKLSTTETTGMIVATWDWTWADSNVAEISWSETQEAWESTNPPSTFNITDTHTGKWYISDLSVGTWYVRVRLGRTVNDVTTWGMYATTDPIKVISVPDRPYLIITPRIITPDQEVKLSWAYSSEDGSPLKRVYIAKEDDLLSPIVTTNQSTITLSQEDLNWENGDEIKLCISTESSENQRSDWSQVTNDSTFRVVSRPTQATVTFTSGWEPNKTVVVDESTTTEPCLVSLPFEFIVDDVDPGNYVTVQIRREVSDIIMKPDESEYPVYANDVVYYNASLIGVSPIEIRQEDLIGSLDDNAYYHLIVTVTDEYGQTPESGDLDYRFRVMWDHKAIMPTAEIDVVRENDVAFITTVQPESGYMEGDTCDIYRLSVDKPELIIENAKFGVPYVDEYPTIGEFGGYRVVYRTFNGDIRTDGGYAEMDYEGEDYSLSDFMSIIDFGRDSVTLRYNLSLSNSWNKDFVETKYLGGAIQGDWNPTVSRSGSIKTTVSIKEDPMHEYPEETIEAMRRLAVYSGICHVRTPDGSNYYANIDVQEDREEKWVTQLAKFSINVTRVDPPSVTYIMRTKAEWESDQEEIE